MAKKSGKLKLGRKPDPAVLKAIAAYQNAGRPRSDRPKIDHGTPELQEKRRMAIGDRNPALSEYPLGVLLANGTITEAQHEAGLRYAWLYGFVVGRTSPAAVAYERLLAEAGEDRAEWPDEVVQAIKRSFQVAAGLLAENRAVKKAVDDLVVFNVTPRWMRPVKPEAGDVNEATYFMVGINALERLFAAAPSRRVGWAS